MTAAVVIVICAVAGMAVGFVGGFWLGDRARYNAEFVALDYALVGGVVGSLAGTIIGAAAFA